MPVVVNPDKLGDLDHVAEDLGDGGRYLQWTITDGEHGVRASMLRIPASYQYAMHEHVDWAQIVVMEGRIRIETADGTIHVVEAGGTYFVPPGERHVETMLEDCLVIVLTGARERYTRKLRRVI